jgi:hypothetical protein
MKPPVNNGCEDLVGVGRAFTGIFPALSVEKVGPRLLLSVDVRISSLSESSRTTLRLEAGVRRPLWIS